MQQADAADSSANSANTPDNSSGSIGRNSGPSADMPPRKARGDAFERLKKAVHDQDCQMGGFYRVSSILRVAGTAVEAMQGWYGVDASLRQGLEDLFAVLSDADERLSDAIDQAHRVHEIAISNVHQLRPAA